MKPNLTQHRVFSAFNEVCDSVLVYAFVVWCRVLSAVSCVLSSVCNRSGFSNQFDEWDGGVLGGGGAVLQEFAYCI